MSPSSSGIKGGQPSTTQPIAIPWLSPKVVTRKRWPKVLWDMGDDRQGKRLDLGLNLTGDLFWRFRRWAGWVGLTWFGIEATSGEAGVVATTIGAGRL